MKYILCKSSFRGNEVLYVMNHDDDRVGTENYQVIGEAKISRNPVLMPNGYKARAVTCEGETFYMYSDRSTVRA